MTANVVTEWNALAAGCATRGGPGALLDIVLAQLAVHNAIQAIEGRYDTYGSAPAANGAKSKAVAAAAAAYRVLSDNRICPAPAAPAADTVQANLDTAFQPYLNSTDASSLALGYAAGDAMLAQYRPLTTTIPLPFLGGTGIGQWRPTPLTNAPMAFVYLATTTPFTLSSPSQYRSGPPPAVTSDAYLKDYNEVKATGGTTSHPATGACPAPEPTDTARFWSGNFVVQWNQAARDIAIDRQLGLGDTARLLALANLAGADSAIAVWDTKVHYNYWRPITAINVDDGNPKTVQDAAWVPFISSSHFPAGSQTPAYPDYTSGANGLTGAFTTMLQLFFQSDHVAFEVQKAVPATVAICTNPRLYRRISDAAEEVVDARILLGIHFRFADTAARTLGTRVAWHAFTKALRPIRKGWDDKDWKD